MSEHKDLFRDQTIRVLDFQERVNPRSGKPSRRAVIEIDMGKRGKRRAVVSEQRGGAWYEEIDSRLQWFWADWRDKGYRLVAQHVGETAGGQIIIRAAILNEKGEEVTSGYAEEVKSGKGVNSTSYVENCETSAIGRALANFGYGGHIACNVKDCVGRPSADEMRKVTDKERGGQATKGAAKPPPHTVLEASSNKVNLAAAVAWAEKKVENPVEYAAKLDLVLQDGAPKRSPTVKQWVAAIERAEILGPLLDALIAAGFNTVESREECARTALNRQQGCPIDKLTDDETVVVAGHLEGRAKFMAGTEPTGELGSFDKSCLICGAPDASKCGCNREGS